MTDHEAFVEFRNGAVLVLAVLALAGLFVATLTPGKEQSKSKFEVVDKYKNCDVVRYTDRSNNWHYLLDCHEVRSSEPQTP